MRHDLLHRYTDLSKDPAFSRLTRLIQQYVRTTVPFPHRTELTYWSLSANPSTNAGSWPRQFTLSIQTLETLFACHRKGDPDNIEINLNVDVAVLLDTYGSVRRPKRKMPHIDVDQGGISAVTGLRRAMLETCGCARGAYPPGESEVQESSEARAPTRVGRVRPCSR